MVLDLPFSQHTSHLKGFIGASQSEPHTNHSYEKIAVPMYVCMYVCMYVYTYVRSDMSSTCSSCIMRARVRISQFGKDRQHR